MDINSDGDTDFLLVGAPTFYQLQEKKEGQIYIYTLTDEVSHHFVILQCDIQCFHDQTQWTNLLFSHSCNWKVNWLWWDHPWVDLAPPYPASQTWMEMNSETLLSELRLRMITEVLCISTLETDIEGYAALSARWETDMETTVTINSNGFGTSEIFFSNFEFTFKNIFLSQS